MEKDPDSEPGTNLVPQSDSEPAEELEELEPTPIEEMSGDPDESVLRVDDPGNELPYQSIGPVDIRKIDMDRPLRATLGKEHRYPPTLTNECVVGVIETAHYNKGL